MQKSNYLNAPISGFRRWMVCLLVLTGLWTMNVNAQNVNVNPGAGSYATLQAAFAAINAGTHTGAVTVDIVGNTTETGTAVLNASGSGSASYTSILIQPSGGVARTITGAIAAGSPMVDFNGADNVTVNGLNTGGNSLTIANTTVSGTSGTVTIRFQTDATSNTITNCSVQSSSTATSGTIGGCIFFGSAAITTGNDNNTISNCDLGPAGANLPTKCICFTGSSNTDPGTANSGIVINNNNIFDYAPALSSTSSGIEINSGTVGTTISNNRFYQTALRTFTVSVTHSAIRISNSSGFGYQITGNIIGYATNSQTGTYSLSFATSSTFFTPITLSVGTTGTITSVQGNTIAGIAITGAGSGTSSSAPFRGIYVSGGLVNIGATSAGASGTGNTIGSQSATGSITYTSTSASNSEIMGMYNFGTSNWVVMNNTVGGITGSNSSTGAAIIYGLRCNTSSLATLTCTNNTIGGTVTNSIQSTTTATGSIVHGILNTLSAATITGNTIRNLTAAGGTGTTTTASLAGIVCVSTSVNNTVSQNTIHSLTNTNAAAATTMTGIQYNATTGTNLISRNFIHSFSPASATAIVHGIQVSGGTSTYQNNMIRLGVDAAGASVTVGCVTNGVNEVSGTNNFYHNSIYIGGSGVSGTVNTFAFNSATTTTRIFRDNIFFNARSNGAGTGVHYAVQVAGTVPNPPGLTINNNLYYANGTGAMFGRFNALNVANLAAWKTAVGQDANSFEGDPQYLAPNGSSATVDLHLNPSIATVAEGNGGLIASVTDDFDGQTRSGLSPVDIGADAGNYIGIDLSAPNITYTALAFTCTTGDRTLSATITDGSGVPAQGSGTEPRIYYKKNAGSYFSQPGTLTSGTVTNGVWSFTIVAADMGGVTVGDVISYYVVAQDVAGPNISSNPAGVTTGTVNSHTAPGSPNTYAINTSLSGTFNVGIGQTYTTLTAAVAAYNTSCLTGPVTFILMDLNYSGSETFPITINANPDASPTNTLTIQPNTGVAASINSTTAVYLLKLNGADYVTVDGLNTGGSSLTFLLNNAAGFSGVWIASASASDGATNNTFRKCTFTGSSGATTISGILAGDGTTAGNPAAAANSNNTIQNCVFTKSQNGIYISGILVTFDQNWLIDGNTFGSAVVADKVGFRGLSVQGVNNFTISNNIINGVSTATTSTATGISVFGSSTNGNIFKNRISDVKNTNTGGYGSNGIYLAASSPSSNVTVYNNFIWDIASYGYASGNGSQDNGSGIIIDGGGGYNIYYNSVQLTTNQTTGITQALNITLNVINANSLNIRNNIFANNQTAGASAATRYAIYSGAANTVFADINYNDYYKGTGTNLGFIGSNRANLAAWQTGTGKDANSKEVNPLYTSTSDLHLQNISTLDAQAQVIATITTDIDNQARNGSTPDIGADEFTACVISANISPSNPSICAGQSQGLTENAGFAASWLWSTSETTQSISVSPSSTTTYTVTVTSGSCTISASTTVTVNPLPAGVTATPSANPVCSGSSINLSSTPSPTNPTLLSEGFEAGAPGWSFQDSSTTGSNLPQQLWHIQAAPYTDPSGSITFSSFSVTGSGFAYTNADAGGSGSNTRTFMVSPSFSTVGYTGNNTLTFKMCYKFWSSSSPAEQVMVQISTDGGATWAATLANYSPTNTGPDVGTTTNNSEVAVPVSVTVPAIYNGFSNVKLRWRYISNWGYVWIVDDVSLTNANAYLYTYSWSSSPAGFTSTAQNPTGVTPTGNTTYTVTVSGVGGCTATASTLVTVNPNPTPSISGATTFCSGGSTTLDGGSGYSLYNWSTGATTQTISPNTAGTFTVTVTDGNGCTGSASATTTVNARPTGALSGTTSICPGGTATLSIAATGSGTISGTLSPGAIPYSGTAPTITVNVSPGATTSYSISTMSDANCASIAGDLTGGATVSIYTTATAPTSVTSDDANNEICAGQQIMLTANGGAFGNAPGSTYKWYEGGCGTGPALGSSSTLSITPTAGTHTYYVRIEDACGNSSCASLVVLVSSGPPSNSVGTPVTPSEACNGTVSLVSVNSVGGPNVKYSWNTGSNSSVVLFSNNIGGPFSPGPFQTTINQVYAQFGALAGSSGYNICVQGVNACGSTNNKCDWIRGVVSVPGTITPPAGVVACPNDVKNYSCGVSGGATVYNWTLGGSATPITSGQGTTNVSVTFPPAFTSAQLCVTAALSCGGSSTSAPRCVTVSKNPAVPGAFTAGPSSVCPGATGVVYTVPAVTGASGYSWTTPAGTTITSGQNTTSITVNFPNPYTGAPPVCVSATSPCGSSAARCKTVGSNLPGQPGAMAGPTTNVCNSTVQYSISNVAGATSYTWTNPSGTTITSGQNTTTILLSVSPSFVSGQLTVVANTNACTPGTSIPRTITINGKPNVPGTITANPAVWCTGGFVNFSVTPVSPLPTYNWTVSNGTITAGQGSNNIDVTWGATAAGTVNVNASNGCGTSSLRSQNFSSGCREESFGYGQDDLYSVYPNPAHDKVTVSVDVKESTTLSLQLMDVSGRVVLSDSQHATAGMNTYDLDLTYVSKGVYMLEVKSATDNWKTKVVVE